MFSLSLRFLVVFVLLVGSLWPPVGLWSVLGFTFSLGVSGVVSFLAFCFLLLLLRVEFVIFDYVGLVIIFGPFWCEHRPAAS